MKHKYHPLKLLLSVVLSVLLLGTFGARSVFANAYGQVDFPFQKVPMLYSTKDPDSGQLHFFFTENVLAKKMKSYELSEKAFSSYDEYHSSFDNVNITDDGEWIYSITYLENSDGIMEKRVARTSTKGLTGSLAYNSKKTEILDMVIASGTDLDKEPEVCLDITTPLKLTETAVSAYTRGFQVPLQTLQRNISTKMVNKSAI